MYGVDGRSTLDEEVLSHLDGYEGAYPVRIGNGAYDQAQHDVWGAAVGAIYQYVRSRDRLDDRLWSIVVTQVEAALENWRGPDRGPWEVRGEPQHFTTSKIACWLAADRGARLASLRGDAKREDRWARGGRRRSGTTCWRTPSTRAGCSASTTRRRGWTRRCC